MENLDKFEFWLFMSGLGIFLFGMYHLEKGLNGLAGHSLKKILSSFTNKGWKGILTGATFTAILQSSSLVSLLSAAFLSAGMLNFKSALGVVLGANLGTTATSWIVALLGFKVNVAQLSYPFLAVGTLSYLMLDNRPILKHIGSFMMGFGLLFLGLDYMKVAIEGYAQTVDIGQFKSYGLWVYVIIGLILTGLIQSSSAMLVIILSALYGGVLDIYQAAALTIGSNIGTTSTLFMASLNGSVDKKRLAAGNILFNTVTAIIGYIFINQIINFIVNTLAIKENVIQLAAFNTLFNLGGIILFFPFLKPYKSFLKKLYTQENTQNLCTHISDDSTEVPDLAIKAISRELIIIFERTKNFILDTVDHSRLKNDIHKSFLSNLIKKEQNNLEDYHKLKQYEDEISVFYNKVASKELSEIQAHELNKYMDQMRSMIYASKSLKDVGSNISEIIKSSDDNILALHNNIVTFVTALLNNYTQESAHADIQHKVKWKEEIEYFYREQIEFIYKEIASKKQKEIPISTLTNVVKKTTASLEELYDALPLKID